MCDNLIQRFILKSSNNMDSMLEEDQTLPLDFNKTSKAPEFPVSGQRYNRQFSSPDGSVSARRNSFHEPGRPKSATFENTSPNRNSMKNHEKVISVLKKENFSLKLRIYYLEEQLDKTFKGDTGGVLKTNIELKVTIEQLKNDVTEKQELLVRASNAIETITAEGDKRMAKVQNDLTHRFDSIRLNLEKQLAEKDGEIKFKDQTIQKFQDEVSELTRLQGHDTTEPEDLSRQDDDAMPLEELRLQLDQINQQLNSKCKDFEDLKKAQQDDENSFKKMVTQLEESLKDKEEEKNAAEQKFEEETKTLRNQIEELSSEVKIFKENNKVVKPKDIKNPSAVTEIKPDERENQDLLTVMKSKDEQLKHSKKFSEELQEKIRLMQVDFFQSKQKTLNSLKVISDKDLELAELHGRLKEKSMITEKLSAENRRRESEYKNLMNAKQRITKETEFSNLAKDKEIQEAKTELNDLKENHSEEIKKLSRLLQECEQELADVLMRKDIVINNMVESITTKDQFIEDLVDITEPSFTTSIDDTSLEKQHGRLIKSMQNRLQEKSMEIQSHSLDNRQSLAGKERDIISLGIQLKEYKDKMDKAQTFANEYKQLNEVMQNVLAQKELEMKEMALNTDSQISCFKENEKILQNDGCQKEVFITKLTELVSNKDKELKDLHTAILTSGVEKETEKEEFNDKLEMIKTQLEERDQMLESFSSARDAAVAQNEKNRQTFISLLQDKDNQLMEEKEKRRFSNADTMSSLIKLTGVVSDKDNQIKALTAELESMRDNTSKAIHPLKLSIAEKDNAIESLARAGCEKDKIINELKNLTMLSGRDIEQSKVGLSFTSKSPDKETSKQRENITMENDLVEGIDQTSTKDVDDVRISNFLKQIVDGLDKTKLDALSSSTFDGQLKAIKMLKEGLEHTFIQNQALKEQLEDKINCINNTDINQKENPQIHEQLQQLRSQLEQSESWNSELQTKLNDDVNTNVSVDVKRQLHATLEENKDLQNKVKRYDTEAEEINKRLSALKQEYQLRCHNDEADRALLIGQINANDNKINELEEEVTRLTELSESFSSLKTELEKAKRATIDSEETIKSLNAKLDGYKNAVDENSVLQSDVQELKALNERLRSCLSQTTQDAIHRNVTSETAAESLTACRLDLENALIKIQSYEAQIKSLQASNKDHADAATQMNDLSKELIRSQKANEQLQSKLNNALSKVASENEREEGEIGLLEDEVKYLRTVNENLKTSLKDINTQYLTLQNASKTNEKISNIENETIKDKYISLEMDNSKLKESCVQLERTIACNASQNTSLKGHVKTLTDTVARQSGEKENLNKEIYNLQERLKRLLSDRISISSQTSFNCQCNQYKSLLVDRDRQIEMLQKQLNIPGMDTDSINHPEQISNNLIEKHISEMQTLRKQLEKSIENNNTLSLQLEHRLADIEEDTLKLSDPVLRSTLIRDNDSLRVQLDSMKQRYAKLQLDSKSNNDELQKQIKDTTERIDALLQDKAQDNLTIQMLREEMNAISKVSETLRDEISVYDELHQRLNSSNQQESNGDQEDNFSLDSNKLQILLNEIRKLRQMLQQSLDSNSKLRQQLEQQQIIHHNNNTDTKGSPKLRGNEDPRVIISIDNNSSSSSHETKLKEILLKTLKTLDSTMTTVKMCPLCSSKFTVWMREMTDCLENALKIITLKEDGSLHFQSRNDSHLQKENDRLRKRVVDLSRKCTSQEETIRSILTRLENQYKLKEGFDARITNELKHTKGVMQKAKKDLQVKVKKPDSPET